MAPLLPFMKVHTLFFGLYSWDVLTSLRLEWDLITRQRRFTLPMLFYLLNKYSFLGALIGGQIRLNGPDGVNCTAEYRASVFLGNISLGLSSINLAIRTVAIWGGNKTLVVVLGVLTVTHIGITIARSSIFFHAPQRFLSVFSDVHSLHAEYIPGRGCSPPVFSHSITNAILIYALCFDALVCGLNLYKLRLHARALLHPSKQTFLHITQLVLVQGLVYFVIAFFLNLSTILVLASNVKTTTFTTYIVVVEGLIAIVACRAVRSLANTLHTGTEVQ
ncbi:hypothetical protein CPB83DRAFT_891863 [Crepidotus variabilis]|uniref:Uncharacterized protein n=1 Tax=Crepidotus variabilis TaxID=179855 RepID=A0A9P6EM90_9AGAR|nr:hypothetical protein CPB83DRAFT_891863 [Crepidotus variabilis]